MERRVALVTGGSKGIGLAIARELAGMGYDIVLVARDRPALKEAAGAISGGNGARVRCFPCDVSDTRQVDRLYSFCASRKLAPSVLVDNAGIYFDDNTEKSEIGSYDKMMSVNFRGMFYLMHRFIPLLKRKKGARVFLTASSRALDDYPAQDGIGGTLYSISKWAVRGWSKSLRAELRRYGVGVTVIYPGATRTDLWRGSKTPKGDFVQPEDIAKLVGTALSLSKNAVIEDVVIRPLRGEILE